MSKAHQPAPPMVSDLIAMAHTSGTRPCSVLSLLRVMVWHHRRSCLSTLLAVAEHTTLLPNGDGRL
jgi:hypothetical protein